MEFRGKAFIQHVKGLGLILSNTKKKKIFLGVGPDLFLLKV
jgi:hypothetical protein